MREQGSSPSQHKCSSERRGASLCLRERLIALSLAFAVCAPPWFLGGMRWWQQLVFLGLAFIPFVLVFLPFGGATNSGGEQFKRLLRFPVFWICLALFAYIAIGAFNVSWEYVLSDGGRKYHMQRLPAGDYLTWLPNGIEAPFSIMNPWRVLILYATGLLLACAVWLGFERRRGLWLVAAIVSVNAFLVSLLTILQSLAGTKLIYWTYKPANHLFAGPFQYRNHDAAYLYLGLACCLACAFYHWKSRQAAKSNPAPLFLFFALVIGAALLFAGSRGGILFGGLVVIAAVVGLAASVLRQGLRALWVSLGVLCLLAVAVSFSWPLLIRSMPTLKGRFEQTERQFHALLEGKDVGDSRVLMNRATLDMWSERPWLGWGGGSYRFMITKFQIKYRELYYAPWTIKRAERMPNRHRPMYQAIYHAHNDWAQSLAEYGIVGSTILLSSLLFWFGIGLRHITELSVPVFMLFSSAAIMMLHGFVDFLFWSPPILFLFVVILAMAGKHMTLSGQRSQAII